MAFDAQNYSEDAMTEYAPADATRPGRGLHEMIAEVRRNSEIVVNSSGEYRKMLGDLQESAFVKAMRDLQNSIIN